MSSSYSEKLADSRWQNRRQQILKRDNHTCTHYGCASKEHLEVHHFDYWPGREPWEYPDNLLTTLCRTHHKQELSREKAENDLRQCLKDRGFLVGDLIALSCKLYTDPSFIQSLLKSLRSEN